MTPEDCVAATKKRIGKVGGAFMLDPVLYATGKELGFAGIDVYYRGRGGVLGEVDADVVHAVFAFFPYEQVVKAWERGAAVMSAGAAVEVLAEACAEWGRVHLAGNDEATLTRLGELLEAVADAVDPIGLPLFAGWRAVDRPLDPAARVAHGLHVLREHRGAAHVVAVAASGLTPLQAIMSGPYGRANAEFFRWPEPYPDGEPFAAVRAQAEATTDRLVTPPFAEALDDAGRAELAGLVTGMALA